MKNQAHAHDLLLSIDPQQSIASLAELLIQSTTTNDTFKSEVIQAFEAVQNRLNNEANPLISQNGMKEYFKIRRKHSYTLSGVPDFIHPILSTIYLKAKSELTTKPKNVIGDLKNKIKEVPSAIREFPADFFESLLLESESRAKQFPHFSNTLDSAIREIGEQLGQFELIRESAVQLMQRRSGSGEDHCCTVTATNALGQRRKFGIESCAICFLILIGIIIMIILL